MKLNLRGDTLVAKGRDGHDVFLPTLCWQSAHSFLDDWDKPLAICCTRTIPCTATRSSIGCRRG